MSSSTALKAEAIVAGLSLEASRARAAALPRPRATCGLATASRIARGVAGSLEVTARQHLRRIALEQAGDPGDLDAWTSGTIGRHHVKGAQVQPQAEIDRQVEITLANGFELGPVVKRLRQIAAQKLGHRILPAGAGEIGDLEIASAHGNTAGVERT